MASNKRKSIGHKNVRRSNPINDFDDDIFLSKENELRYHSVLNSVKLHNEKWLDKDIYISNIASIKSWLEHMGWFDYLCSYYIIYPRLVKLFYANLEKTTICVVKSFVLGDPVEITPKIITETLGIPCSGITHFNDIGKSDALEIFLERSDFNSLMTVTSSHLPIATRILLLIVTNTLLPRECSHTLPSERDLKLVACIKNGTLVNLPYLIINPTLSRPNYILYPMFISRILAYLNLDITDEHNDKPKTKQLINKAGLKSCNIKFEDRLWVKQQVGGRRATVRESGVGIGGDDVEEEEEEEDDGNKFEMRPNIAGGNSNGGSRPTLDSLQARMDLAQANIDYIRGRVDQIYDNQATLMTHLDTQDVQMAQVIQMLQNTYPQQPPPGSS
ncbi:hypothetical protein CFOL_v3_25566 [Cephalotus follicularis]|uniref:Putative plant transposon protein domain-containing protein n=1 Tax=Cephalotus follicularis TaxID=3775 RepID=A0A1Q3CPV5_CEPFO|nr:hypothetical protein CFOL_v3_25566 [Cephalotus follicularis]